MRISLNYKETKREKYDKMVKWKSLTCMSDRIFQKGRKEIFEEIFTNDFLELKKDMNSKSKS